MLQWGAYREGKCNVSKIEICEYGIGLHIQKGFIWSYWSKTVLIPPSPQQFALQMLIFGHVGSFVLFYLEMPAYPIISQI